MLVLCLAAGQTSLTKDFSTQVSMEGLEKHAVNTDPPCMIAMHVTAFGSRNGGSSAAGVSSARQQMGQSR